MKDLNKQRDEIHAANVRAGWWSDLKTGESILETRNRPEMLCLVMSELIEAYEDGMAPDGHLPDYPAFNVEIADTAIRIFDMAGGDKIDLNGGTPVELTGIISTDILSMIVFVAHALEGFRKGNTEKYHASIRNLFSSLIATAEKYDFDLWEVIDAKVAYNSQRADHKVENRKKEGGKAL